MMALRNNFSRKAKQVFIKCRSLRQFFLNTDEADSITQQIVQYFRWATVMLQFLNKYSILQVCHFQLEINLLLPQLKCFSMVYRKNVGSHSRMLLHLTTTSNFTGKRLFIIIQDVLFNASCAVKPRTVFYTRY